MKEKLLALLRFVQDRAGRPVEGKVYVDTGPVLEREFAVRAGLGWFGKHTNLIHKRVGSWLLIGEILLDIELDPDGPAADHCGTCTLCLEACPTDAIVEPYVVDSRRCISYHTIELKGAIPPEYRAAMGDRVFGCDDCQDVCPWNRSAPETGHPAFAARPWNEMPDLIEMLGLTPETFRTRFKGSPRKTDEAAWPAAERRRSPGQHERTPGRFPPSPIRWATTNRWSGAMRPGRWETSAATRRWRNWRKRGRPKKIPGLSRK